MMACDLAGRVEIQLARHEFAVGSRGQWINGSDVMAEGLQWLGRPDGKGSIFACILGNDLPSISLVFGAIVSGSTLISLPRPPRHSSGWDQTVRRAAAAFGLSSVVVGPTLASAIERAGLSAVLYGELSSRRNHFPSASGHFKLVQFTSGSEGAPKGVALTAAELAANLEAIGEEIFLEPGESSVSWLPLSHDFGLVGMLLAPVHGGDMSGFNRRTLLLEPTTFLRNSNTWLSAIDELKATISGSPAFGCRHALRRPFSGELSSLRHLIVGGDLISAHILRQFDRSLGAIGLQTTALRPAYGMAEIGLCATASPVNRPWRSITLSSDSLGTGRSQARRLEAEFVATGPPLAGYEVALHPTHDGDRILIAGPSIGSDPKTGRTLASHDGMFLTGDIGCLDDGGDLIVLGRADDYVKVHGRKVHAPTVEQQISELIPGAYALLLADHAGLAVVVESPERQSSAEKAQLRRIIRQSIIESTDAAPSEIRIEKRGWIPRTPSGKARRSAALQRHRLTRDSQS